jgi:hypothetical protein
MPSLLELLDHPRAEARSAACSVSRAESYVDLKREVFSREPSADPATRFLESVYKMVKKPDPEDALDLIYREMDAWLRGGAFERCDNVLRLVDVGLLPTVHVLAFVSITSTARARLSRRSEFVAGVRKVLDMRQPTSSDVDALLSGIE